MLDFAKIQNPFSLWKKKKAVKRIKRQARDWGEIFAKQISDNLPPKHIKNS